MNIYKYLTIKENTHYININSSIRQVIEKFDFHKFSVVPLLDDNGKYVGTISEGDILRFIKNHSNMNLTLAESISIKDIDKYRMYKTLSIYTDEEHIFNLALEQNFIPMVDGRNVFIGIIKRKEILTYFYNEYKKTKNNQ